MKFRLPETPAGTKTRKTDMARKMVAPAAVLLMSSGLALAGCSGSEGGEVGFNAFTRASAGDMPTLCEEFFGDAERISAQFDVDVYVEEPSSNTCVYETSGGDTIYLGIADVKPDATSVGRSEGYYAFANYSLTLEDDVAKEIGPWLERRAAAVTDDLETWTAELPRADAALASDDVAYDPMGQELDPVEQLSGSLLTPASRVAVLGLSRPAFVDVAGEMTQPAEGHDFVQVALSVHALELDDAPKATYHVEANGTQLASAAAVLDRVVAGAAYSMLLSIPEGTTSLDLVATVAEGTQKISLLTGAVNDEGRSERLALAKQGSLEFARSQATASDADGDEAWRFSYDQPYSSYATWTSTPYSTSGGWSKAGEHFLTVDLEPSTPEAAHELTAADAVVTINGQEHAATSFDPASHAFTFVIPDTTSRYRVDFQAIVDTSIIDDEWDWDSSWTLDGPEKNTASVDVFAAGSPIYTDGLGDEEGEESSDGDW